MINATANIYVSVGQVHHQESNGSHGYKKENTLHMISVEPHRFQVPGMAHHEAPHTHFEAIKDHAASTYGLVKYTSKDPPGIIGNILIADSAHTTVDKIHNVLSEAVSLSLAGPNVGDTWADNEDEHWIKTAIHALQDHDMVVKFKIDEFITWTHSYLMDRQNNEAPALACVSKSAQGPRAKGKQPQILDLVPDAREDAHEQ